MTFFKTSHSPLHLGSGMQHGPSSEITPRGVYEGRRQWLKQASAGLAGAGVGLAGSGLPLGAQAAASVQRPGKLAALPAKPSTLAGAQVMDKLTPYGDVTTYNNFYEFGTDKSDPAEYAHTLKTRPWTLSVEGEVGKPLKLGLDDLLKLAEMEERI